MSRVCVIGAGAAGLSVLRTIPSQLIHNGIKVTCFEASNTVGGEWNQYRPKATPKNNVYSNINEEVLPESSMYKNLITNLPTCFMQYPDYDWDNNRF